MADPKDICRSWGCTRTRDRVLLTDGRVHFTEKAVLTLVQPCSSPQPQITPSSSPLLYRRTKSVPQSQPILYHGGPPRRQSVSKTEHAEASAAAAASGNNGTSVPLKLLHTRLTIIAGEATQANQDTPNAAVSAAATASKMPTHPAPTARLRRLPAMSPQTTRDTTPTIMRTPTPASIPPARLPRPRPLTRDMSRTRIRSRTGLRRRMMAVIIRYVLNSLEHVVVLTFSRAVTTATLERKKIEDMSLMLSQCRRIWYLVMTQGWRGRVSFGRR